MTTTYALVTGASSGIGKAIAEELARKGNNILLISNAEKVLVDVANAIASKYGVITHSLSIDLSQAEAANTIMQWINHNQFEVSILVNNAGFGVWGPFESVPLEEQLEMMRLNMMSVVSITHQMIPVLKRNKQAYIMIVSSVGAYASAVNFAVYGATKAFLLMFSRGLRSELKNSNISLTCLVPGAVITGFVERAKMTERHKKMNERYGMQPKQVSISAVNAMLKNRREVIPGFSNRLVVLAIKITPIRIMEYLSSYIYSK